MVENRKAIYIAILNQGEIAAELSQLLNVLITSTDFYLFVDYSAEKPISYNRNCIVKRFLERKQYDYLMMIDSDIVPPANILDLILYDKDIISPVCFAYTKKSLFPLVLKQQRKKAPGSKYKAYESIRPDKWKGLLEVDAVGTGAIIIKREVLEKIPYPFRNEYDKTGEKQIGLDINFCFRVKKLGFKIFCHTDYISSHWTRFDLRNIYYTMTEEYKKREKLEEELKLLKKSVKNK